jgi:hypothetical protein
MKRRKGDRQDRATPPPEDRPPKPPAADTSSDRDEWMEKHVADAEGKIRSEEP